MNTSEMIKDTNRQSLSEYIQNLSTYAWLKETVGENILNSVTDTSQYLRQKNILQSNIDRATNVKKSIQAADAYIKAKPTELELMNMRLALNTLTEMFSD
jgi:hypothetical protein